MSTLFSLLGYLDDEIPDTYSMTGTARERIKAAIASIEARRARR